MRIFIGSFGRALIWAFASFLGSFLICFVVLASAFERHYPHDGQNGLGAFLYGYLLASSVGGVVLLIAFLVIYLRRVAEE